MRKSLIIFSVLLICCLFVGFASASPQGGLHDGVYLIYDESDLSAFATYIDNYGTEATNAKLMSDINFNNGEPSQIGTSNHPYAGIFDGNGYYFKNILLDHTLFYGTTTAKVTKLGIKDSTFSTTSLTTNGVFKSSSSATYMVISQCTFDNLILCTSLIESARVENCNIINSNTDIVGSSSVQVDASLIGQIGSTASNKGLYNTYATGTVSISEIYRNVGGLSGRNGVYVEKSVSLISSVTYSGSGITGNTHGRISGTPSSGTSLSLSNNYALSTSYATYSWTPTSSATGTDGADIIPSQVNQAFFQNTLGWNFANTWYWDSSATWQDKNGVTYYGLPKLQVFRETGSPSVTVTTPSSPVAINTVINLEADASPYVLGNHLTYNWQYSTNGGSSWSASIGTTEDITYTPTGNPAVYLFRCTVTETETTLSASATTNDVRVVTTPTITTATITPSIGKLSTAYTPAITIPITGLGGAQTVYYKLQQLSGSTWSDISGKAGTATATGSKTLTVSINDASETTHSYRVLVSSLSDYTASVTATSNTVTFQTFAPPATPTAEINPATITINTATEVTLNASNVPTAPAGNTYYYQWYYGSTSTPSAGDTAITEQETTLTNPATWSATFTATGTKYVYLKITDAAGNDPVYSARQTLTISNYAPPTITMVSRQTSSPALTGSDVKVKVIATSYEGTTTHLTYKWYYAVSSASPEWTEISGQTTNILTTQFSTEGTYMLKCVVTDTSISMSTDSYTAGKYATVQIVPQPSISAVAVNPYVLDLSVSTTVQLSASVTNPSGVSSLVWQVQKDGGEWTNTPLTLDHGTVTVSSAGTYLYRLQVTPIVGSVITSENTHSVVAGTLPVISIVSPPNNSQYGVGETIQINATGTGVTAIQWSFGDGVKASGNTNTLTPWVQYTGIGIHTITLTAANSFGNKTASIQIIVSSAKRPLATSTPAPIKDANMVYEWMENFNPQSAEDQSPDVMGIFKGLTAPFTNVMGQWFYLALFGIPYLLIWIRTRNTIIPSIIGILFGAWLWVMLPGSAMAAAVCILILSVSGGIFGIYLSRRQRE